MQALGFGERALAGGDLLQGEGQRRVGDERCFGSKGGLQAAAHFLEQRQFKSAAANGQIDGAVRFINQCAGFAQPAAKGDQPGVSGADINMNLLDFSGAGGLLFLRQLFEAMEGCGLCLANQMDVTGVIFRGGQADQLGGGTKGAEAALLEICQRGCPCFNITAPGCGGGVAGDGEDEGWRVAGVALVNQEVRVVIAVARCIRRGRGQAAAVETEKFIEAIGHQLLWVEVALEGQGGGIVLFGIGIACDEEGGAGVPHYAGRVGK